LALFKEASELAQKQTKLAVGVDNATDPRKLALSVALVIARLFGKDAGRDAASRWEVPVPAGLLKTARSKGEMRRRAARRKPK
jgi:hypothetical protein